MVVFLFILSIKLEITKNIPWNNSGMVHLKTGGFGLLLLQIGTSLEPSLHSGSCSCNNSLSSF